MEVVAFSVALEKCDSVPNLTVRSRLISPERSSFKPARLRVPLNPLSSRASHIRTKMAVVRLHQRKRAESGRKWSEMGLSAGAGGSDK